jgi:hypothetical protein
MAISVVMPWFNPYASIASATGGFVTTNKGQICDAGSGTISTTLGTRKTYATLQAIAADTATGTAHSGCPIIPCASADALVFQFLAFMSITNAAAENHLGDSVNADTLVQRFTVWGIRPQYANGIDDGPYVVEPVVTWRVTATSTGGVVSGNYWAAPNESEYSPLLDGRNVFPGEPASSVSGQFISLATSSTGTATTNSIDINALMLAKAAGLATSTSTLANFTSTVVASNTSGTIGYHSIVGIHRYSHFMLATRFGPTGTQTGPFPRMGAICLGLSTT